MNLIEERYGYRVIGGRYQPIDGEQAVIARLIELRIAGAEWETVADWLNTRVDAEPPSDTLWRAEVVERIYVRETGGEG